MHLSHRDFDAVQRAILEIHEACTHEAFDAEAFRIALNIVLVHDSRDFNERDRFVLNLLRPHLTQARRIAAMLSERPKAQAPDSVANGSPGVCRLTLRELEVARWVAEGKTNPEIGIILGASPRTIEKHMEKILDKLGVENRTAAAAALIKAPVNFNSAQ